MFQYVENIPLLSNYLEQQGPSTLFKISTIMFVKEPSSKKGRKLPHHLFLINPPVSNAWSQIWTFRGNVYTSRLGMFFEWCCMLLVYVCIICAVYFECSCNGFGLILQYSCRHAVAEPLREKQVNILFPA